MINVSLWHEVEDGVFIWPLSARMSSVQSPDKKLSFLIILNTDRINILCATPAKSQAHIGRAPSGNLP